jgi:hypothetical protein
MDDQKRGDDAADHAPRPGGEPQKPKSGMQDAANYDERDDGGRAIPDEDLSSANDE